MIPIDNLPKPSSLSAGFSNASILLYTLWLLLPALQTTGRAATGAIAVCLFGVGVLLDRLYLKTHWAGFLLRCLCAAVLPLVMRFFLRRGAESFAGYYAQQVMFWYPLIWCGYARVRGDERLWRFLNAALLGAMAFTTLTTIGWLVQGMLRGGRVYAYSRSLGWGGSGREAYLKELMGRNIGGYDFIYASMLSLPLGCYYLLKTRGWKRAGFAAFCGAQLVMIALSQYTYGLIFAVALTGMELLAACLRRLVRKIRKQPLGVGPSLLWVLPLFAAVYLLRVPLAQGAAALCRQIGFESIAYSLDQLVNALTGSISDVVSRADYYRLPLGGLAASPLIGALPGMNAPLSQHSDLLDLLSATGVLGTAAFLFLVGLMGRGCLRGMNKSAAKPHLWLQYTALLAISLLGIVTYSRDIPLALCAGALLILGQGQQPDLGNTKSY
ncbi:MAG: hypothetical protein FWF86_00145 [Clostridia bacterium]|nr:hypothetical protein [Clostridia bacterium]